jgi:uncharacterized membrane protein
MDDKNVPSEKGHTILKIFNYIGGALIFFGVAYFIGSNWYQLSNFIKVFVTLGVAIATFIVGICLQFANKENASNAFYLIAGLILPFGLFITYKVYHLAIPLYSVDLVIASICFIVFLISQLRSPRTIFQIFCILFGTFLYFSIIEFLLYGKPVHIGDLNEYELIVLGTSFILLGHYLSFSSSVLSGPLYFLGTLIVLTSVYCLGTYNDPHFIFHWRLIALLCIILAFVLAVPLQSKSFLYVGSLFLVIYIVDMSMRFADVFGDAGWSLILVIAGLLFIVIGYIVFSLHKKMSKKS